MKKNLLFITLLFCVFSINAQWIQVNNGLPDYPPTTIINWVDTMVVSTYGGGIYLTYDQGENWSEMSGTLPNLFVNKIMYRGGQFDPISVSTDGGPFINLNGGYIDCNGTGLTNTSISFWSGVGSSLPYIDYALVGTNGDGVFGANYTSPLIYDWFPANTGISGDASQVNDGIAAGEDMAIIATDGGIFKIEGSETEWTSYNGGLSGDALKVNELSFGYYMISTDDGLYFSMDLNEDWQPVITGEKFNVSFYMNTDISPSGFLVYAFGENGYYSQDFITWTQMDFSGMEGEVTAAQADSVNLYIGFTTTEKSTKGSGGIYRKPLEQFLVGIEDESLSGLSKFSLEQNHPNPFSQSTNISYSLKKSDFVSLKVYDFAGREIKTLINNFQEKGIYSVVFNAENLPNGIYSYKLQIGNNFYKTKKMMLIK